MSSTSTPPLRSVRLAGGADIAYREVGSGPSVVLLHGFPTSSYLWREVMAPIAVTHRVVAVDLPGYGYSDKPADAAYDLNYYEGILETFADALGLGQVGVAGHDIGGAVAAYWAIRRPEHVRRLALLNTVLYPDFSSEVIEFATACRTPALAAELTSDRGLANILRRGVHDDLRITGETLRAYLEPFADADRSVLARAAVGIKRSDFQRIAAGLAGLVAPLCAVYGEDDRLLGDNSETFARLRRDNPRVEVTAIERAGHFLQEDASERVGRLLAEFFTGDKARLGTPDRVS